jgi:hypothetical protein
MKPDTDLKNKVKKILKLVEELAPGRSVELRIPPYAAIQCVQGGNHRRGTPPNVDEMNGETLIDLAQNPGKWGELCSKGFISASGTSSNLGKLFNQVSKLVSNFDEELSDGK